MPEVITINNAVKHFSRVERHGPRIKCKHCGKEIDPEPHNTRNQRRSQHLNECEKYIDIDEDEVDSSIENQHHIDRGSDGRIIIKGRKKDLRGASKVGFFEKSMMVL